MNEWNDIKDKKPEIGQACLVYETYPKGTMFNLRANPLKYCFYEIAEYYNDDTFVNYKLDKFKYVSHWMKLPEKPNETL